MIFTNSQAFGSNQKYNPWTKYLGLTFLLFLSMFSAQTTFGQISNGFYQLKTHHNTFLQTKPNGTVACSPNSSTWETFEVKVVGTNKIQLRGYHGSFLQAKSDGKVATTKNSSTWETFTLVSKGGNNYSLKTHHNTFLQARPEKTVTTTTNSSTWETFSFKKVAKPGGFNNQQANAIKISNGYYQLKTHHNTFLQTKPNGEVASSPNSSTWETFEVKVVGTDKIQLRGYHGSFLQAKPDGKVATTSNSSTWETFSIISKGGDKFLLKTYHNNFLQAKPDKTVATSPNSSVWETFSFKKVAKPAPQKETGFRVIINGVQCLQSADGGNNVDELYMEVYVDGVYVGKLGPRDMNEGPQNDWERFWDDLVMKETNDNIATWIGIAKREYWLLPGSYYVKDNIKIELWEDDAGGKVDKAFSDDDDYIGKVVINKSTANSNYILKEFRSSEEGDWNIVCSKTTRGDFDPTVEGTVQKVKVRVPVLDQGNEGACVAFSVVGGLTTSYLNRTKPGNSKEELFDPMALYDQRNKTDHPSGWKTYKCLNHLLKNGIPFKNSAKKLHLKSYYSYHKDGRILKHTINNLDGSPTAESKKHNNGYNNMRKVLKSGEPLLCRYDVYPDFMAYADFQGVYGGRIYNGSANPTGHAVFVVGYTNPKLKANDSPTWILQNSWSSGFGVNGLCRFAEGACGFDSIMYKIGEFEVK
jgi:hypothetical protein